MVERRDHIIRQKTPKRSFGQVTNQTFDVTSSAAKNVFQATLTSQKDDIKALNYKQVIDNLESYDHWLKNKGNQS